MRELAIYHGNEEWVLKGVAIDFCAEFVKLGIDSVTFGSFNGPSLKSKWHMFVQQGQLSEHVRVNGTANLERTLCLFTHLDVGNFNKSILNRCHTLVFMSSMQFSNAIANGINPKLALLLPHGVSEELHKILPPSLVADLPISTSYTSSITEDDHRKYTVFCGRYWEKITYQRRKNYDVIKRVVYDLVSDGFPVLVIGPGWDRFLTDPHPLLKIIEIPYKEYPKYYNLGRCIVSLSIHEGGPLPLLEGMRCGLIPISTNTGFAMDVISGTPGRVLSGITSYPDLIETIKQSFTSYSHEQATRISDHASQFTFYRSAQSIARRLHLDSKHAVTKTTCMESSDLLSAPLLPRDVCLNDGGLGNNVIKAIHDGLPDSHLLSPSEISGKHPSIVWGILRGSDSVIGKCQLHNSDWYHIDHSYLNRGHSRGFYRISYKSYSLGENLRLCDSSRLRLFDYSLRPWRKSGNSILVCPPTQYFSKYHRASNWLEETIEQLKLYTNRPIIVRHKPTPSNPSVPLLQQLDNAWALVTHSSNVAVEAVLDGVPAFVSDRSACASLGNTDLRNIDSPHYSDRELWLANITHSQFSIEEFRRGEAFEKFLAYLQCPTYNS